MFAPHHSLRSASPQRKRMVMAPYPQLGNEEATSVGPSKLFSDLKQSTSASKKTPFSKNQASPSRAFAVKNTQSPTRRQGGSDEAGSSSSVPIKPTRVALPTASSGNGKQKQKQKETLLEQPTLAKSQPASTAQNNQLVSPSKASARVDAIFAGSVSPSKKKKSTRSGRDADASPSKKRDEPVLLPSPQKTPQAARASLGTQKTPKTDIFAANKNALVTPAANIGSAGLERMRMGEMLDALHEQAGGADVHEGEPDTAEAEAMTEEELYPEIEYMPPRVEVPHELPPALDGLPRGAEMGEMLANLQFGGFYKPTSRESIEAERQAIVASLPDRIELEEDFTKDHLSESEDEGPWPDVEIEQKSEQSAKTAINQKGPLMHQPARPQQQTSSLQRTDKTATAAKTQSTSSRSIPRSAVPSRLPVSTRPAASSTSRPQSSSTAKVASKHSQSVTQKPAAPVSGLPRKGLLSDKSNTHRMAPASQRSGAPKSAAKATKKVINPALTDFENDALGKSLRAKLAALEAEQDDVVGFAL